MPLKGKGPIKKERQKGEKILKGINGEESDK